MLGQVPRSHPHPQTPTHDICTTFTGRHPESDALVSHLKHLTADEPRAITDFTLNITEILFVSEADTCAGSPADRNPHRGVMRTEVSFKRSQSSTSCVYRDHFLQQHARAAVQSQR